MLQLLLAFAVSQTPAPSSDDLALLAVVRDDPGPVAAVEAQLRESLNQANIVVQSAARTQTLLGAQTPATCQTNVPCYGLLGRSLGVPIVVRVEASAVETDLAVFAQAIATDSLKVVAEASFVTEAKAAPATLRQRLEPLVSAVGSHLGRDPRPQQPVATAPTNGAVASPPPAAVTEPVAPASSKRLWALAPAAAGVVAAGAGAYFLGDAHATHAALRAESGPKLSADAAVAERDRGARNQTFGWIGLVAGAALIGTGATLWFLPAEDVQLSASAAPGGFFVEGAF